MLLEGSSPDGFLFGLDRDPNALALAEEKLARFVGRFKLIRSDFRSFQQVVPEERKGKFNGILADLGVSTMQLEEAERGFSFRIEGPLDMRMDPDAPMSAADLVRDLPERELEKIIRVYGEERFSPRIARAIVRERAAGPIETTVQLADLVRRAFPASARHGRIHPATRTFQALRIAVNRELEGLAEFISAAYEWLIPGGRLGVISFHSLEDRIVKRTFLTLVDKEKKGDRFSYTRKPVIPSDEETESNPASRSAKLRVIERSL